MFQHALRLKSVLRLVIFPTMLCLIQVYALISQKGMMPRQLSWKSSVHYLECINSSVWIKTVSDELHSNESDLPGGPENKHER
jgi:hypothetical protein